MEEIEVEAFRADQKASKGLTSAHIAEAASLYDATVAPAPLVFGHPTNDSPALGHVSGARVEGNKLFLKLKGIAADVIEGVKERRILGRSIAFWHPQHPSNPNPGKYSIRHLGLLGGQAPAIPGLPALKFSADDGDENEPADAVIFAVEEPEAPTPVQTITEPAPQAEQVQEPTMTLEEQLAAATARADQAEADATALRTAEENRATVFAATEAARRETENVAILDQVVADGRILPVERDNLAKLFSALPTEALTFSDGDLEPRVALGQFLAGLPKRAPIGDKPVVQIGDAKFSADDAKAIEVAALNAARERMANAYKPA